MHTILCIGITRKVSHKPAYPFFRVPVRNHARALDPLHRSVRVRLELNLNVSDCYGVTMNDAMEKNIISVYVYQTYGLQLVGTSTPRMIPQPSSHGTFQGGGHGHPQKCIFSLKIA